MSIADLARRAAKFAVENSPNILTVIGAAGTVTTAYLAGKASFQAADLIRLKENSDAERGVTLGTPREVAKDRLELVWRLYIPPAVMMSATLAAIIGSNRVSAGRAGAIVTAYGLLEKNFADHQQKVVDTIGAKKEEMIRSEIAQDTMEQNPIKDFELLDVDNGQLCMDTFSARYFRGTVEGIRSAVNTINNMINHDGVATLGDLYRELDIPPTEYSDLVGWNSDRLVEETISTALSQNGDTPVIVLGFRNNPSPDYSRRFR